MFKNLSEFVTYSNQQNQQQAHSSADGGERALSSRPVNADPTSNSFTPTHHNTSSGGSNSSREHAHYYYYHEASDNNNNNFFLLKQGEGTKEKDKKEEGEGGGAVDAALPVQRTIPSEPLFLLWRENSTNNYNKNLMHTDAHKYAHTDTNNKSHDNSKNRSSSIVELEYLSASRADDDGENQHYAHLQTQNNNNCNKNYNNNNNNNSFANYCHSRPRRGSSPRAPDTGAARVDEEGYTREMEEGGAKKNENKKVDRRLSTPTPNPHVFYVPANARRRSWSDMTSTARTSANGKENIEHEGGECKAEGCGLLISTFTKCTSRGSACEPARFRIPFKAERATTTTTTAAVAQQRHSYFFNTPPTTNCNSNKKDKKSFFLPFYYLYRKPHFFFNHLEGRQKRRRLKQKQCRVRKGYCTLGKPAIAATAATLSSAGLAPSTNKDKSNNNTNKVHTLISVMEEGANEKAEKKEEDENDVPMPLFWSESTTSCIIKEARMAFGVEPPHEKPQQPPTPPPVGQSIKREEEKENESREAGEPARMEKGISAKGESIIVKKHPCRRHHAPRTDSKYNGRSVEKARAGESESENEHTSTRSAALVHLLSSAEYSSPFSAPPSPFESKPPTHRCATTRNDKSNSISSSSSGRGSGGRVEASSEVNRAQKAGREADRSDDDDGDAYTDTEEDVHTEEDGAMPFREAAAPFSHESSPPRSPAALSSSATRKRKQIKAFLASLRSQCVPIAESGSDGDHSATSASHSRPFHSFAACGCGRCGGRPPFNFYERESSGAPSAAFPSNTSITSEDIGSSSALARSRRLHEEGAAGQRVSSASSEGMLRTVLQRGMAVELYGLQRVVLQQQEGEEVVEGEGGYLNNTNVTDNNGDLLPLPSPEVLHHMCGTDTLMSRFGTPHRTSFEDMTAFVPDHFYPVYSSGTNNDNNNNSRHHHHRRRIDSISTSTYSSSSNNFNDYENDNDNTASNTIESNHFVSTCCPESAAFSLREEEAKEDKERQEQGLDTGKDVRKTRREKGEGEVANAEEALHTVQDKIAITHLQEWNIILPFAPDTFSKPHSTPSCSTRSSSISSFSISDGEGRSRSRGDNFSGSRTPKYNSTVH